MGIWYSRDHSEYKQESLGICSIIIINKYLLNTYYTVYIAVNAKDSALTKAQFLPYETYIQIKATKSK